jgi:hypothetical protein
MLKSLLYIEMLTEGLEKKQVPDQNLRVEKLNSDPFPTARMSQFGSLFCISRCVFEPWRAIHGSIFYVYCASITDLYASMKNLNGYKSKYQSQSTDFKLIFLSNESNKEFLLGLADKLAAWKDDCENPIENEALKNLKQIAGHFIFLTLDNGGISSVESYTTLKDSVQDLMQKICLKISDSIDAMSLNDEKQLNFAADYLKTPLERATDVQNTTQLMFKFFNKKKVIGRMHKHRADLYLELNCIETAFSNYLKAYNLLKNEKDSLWTASALLGKTVT